MQAARHFHATRSFAAAGVAIVGAAVLVAPPAVRPADAIAVSHAPVALAASTTNPATQTGELLVEYVTVNVPVNLTNVLAAGAENPEDIPGLASFMAHCLFLPAPYADFENEQTLAYRLTAPTIAALDGGLPAPLGSGGDPNVEPGLVRSASGLLGGVVIQALGALPAEVFPADRDLTEGIPLPPLSDVLEDPSGLPATAVSLGNGGVDVVQAAARGVVPSVVRVLPEPIRAPITDVSGQLNDVVDGVQDVASGPVSPIPSTKLAQARGATDLSDGNKAAPRARAAAAGRTLKPVRDVAHSVSDQVGGIVAAVSYTVRSIARPASSSTGGDGSE